MDDEGKNWNEKGRKEATATAIATDQAHTQFSLSANSNLSSPTSNSLFFSRSQVHMHKCTLPTDRDIINKVCVCVCINCEQKIERRRKLMVTEHNHCHHHHY